MQTCDLDPAARRKKKSLALTLWPAATGERRPNKTDAWERVGSPAPSAGRGGRSIIHRTLGGM